MVLLMLLSGVACCPFFFRRDHALSVLLSADRRGPWHQIAGEYAAYFIMMLINTALLFGVLAIGAGEAVSLIPELAGLTPGGALLLFLQCLPALLAITALQFALYELVDSVVSGMLCQVLCAIGLAYVSGCLYPIRFFPKSIQVLSALLPSGIARAYLSSCIAGGDGLWAAAALIGYAGLLLGGAVLARRRRIQWG